MGDINIHLRRSRRKTKLRVENDSRNLIALSRNNVNEERKRGKQNVINPLPSFVFSGASGMQCIRVTVKL